ncbi:Transcription repressor OFP17 [Sesamum alatum]|uniref:Transcription repressor OFP17 n=1 Tax=Sesamum alatum TaxID=300844 RepID=A0AAE1XXH5_9LAMI|nr:Transcription repressor OFP17 [Sesamum alatum]
MKLTNPCKKILQLFKFRLRKPVFVRALKFRHLKPNIKIRSRHGGFRLSKILSALHSLRRKREVSATDRVDELTGFSESVQHKAPHPSPLTPAYVRMNGEVIRDHDENEVEDACRSFENHLIEMVVEDGRMTDLVDVEELLYCWKNLRSPVFMDLVCRFYGELCKDLFSSSCQNYDVKTPKGLLR